MPEIFRVDLPHVMHEMIDNEVVVVNLDSGTYYSFDGVGGRIWQLLDGEGRSLESLTAQIATVYRGDRDHIASVVAQFMDQLCKEQLVNVVSAEDGWADPDGKALDPEAGQPAFVDPVLHKYTDMEALLLADPIHEVDEEAGWPHVK